MLHEISSAKVLGEQLEFEHRHLNELVTKQLECKTQLDQQLNQQPSFSCPNRAPAALKPRKRCNSNPLDYAETGVLFPEDTGPKVFQTQQSDSSVEYDYEVDVSNIHESQLNSDIYIDSVIMDVFEISQSSNQEASRKD